MRKLLATGLIAIFMLTSCIGTDIVEELIVEEQVNISTAVESLAVGDSFSFTADHFNDLGERTDQSIIWSSSNPAIISIDDAGLAMALNPGNVFISARVGEAVDSVQVNAGQVTVIPDDARRGTLSGLNNYRVEGDFFLEDTGDELLLTLGDNFRSSNGPGLYVYLSNASNRVTGGVEVGRLGRTSGLQTYRISKAQSQLGTFSHVVIYCKPFGVPFGAGIFVN